MTDLFNAGKVKIIVSAKSNPNIENKKYETYADTAITLPCAK